jgi:hypothetical protein
MAEHELTSILIQPKQTSELESTTVLSDKLGLPSDIAREIAQISGKPGIDILSDQPASEDAFGLDALVRTLSKVVLSESTQTPITIGIDGKWGTGKTSILKMIEAQARMLDFPCIWLNAWSLESTENLIAAVASEVQRESKSLRDPDKPRKEFSESFTKWLLQALATIGGTMAPVAGSLLSELVEPMSGIVKASRQREREITEISSVVTTRLSFERLVHLLLRESSHKPSRLVVFIDDIDRALPDQIATILKNLKLVLEIPQCVFVLAMDMDIVAHSIENYYRRRNQSLSLVSINELRADSVEISQVGQDAIELGFGHNYLEKLVQIRIDVPPLTRDSTYEYLREIGVAPEILEIIHWAPDEEVLNPRRLKRYINWLSISLQLVLSVPMLSKVGSTTALRAMALKRDYPELYRHLLERRSTNPQIDVDRLLNIVRDYPEVSQSVTANLKPSEGQITLSRLYDSNRVAYWWAVGLTYLKPNRDFVFPLDEEIVKFERYLEENLPQVKLRAFDEFVRRTPLLDVGYKDQQ